MNKMTIKAAFLLFTVAVLGLSSTVNANVIQGFRLYINDSLINDEAKVIDGKVYIPLDAVQDNLGAQVGLDENSGVVNINTEELTISSVINKVGQSVVGIIGNLKEGSKDYSPYGDNMVFGSGVIYKTNGYIITNSHVVKDMENIVVVLSNGKAYKAKLKAFDERSDLALIKIDKGGLTPAELGSISDINVGQEVIAIGTPMSFSLRNSATKGIISGINRSIVSEYGFIQSDTAINGGNSGGPLVDMNGRIIGINTIKYSGIGVEGLSFSIPVDTVKFVVDHFEKYGMVKRPYLGVEFSEGIAAKYGLPSNEGLTVTDITEGSPAEKSGLQIDDVLTSVNGVKINTKIDYNEEMKKYLPGDTVELSIERNGELVKISVTYDENKQ